MLLSILAAAFAARGAEIRRGRAKEPQSADWGSFDRAMKRRSSPALGRETRTGLERPPGPFKPDLTPRG